MPYLFSQNGPLTRTVRDAALLLQVIAGHDPRDPTSLRQTPPNFVRAADMTIEGLRIGWSPDFGFADVDPEVLDITFRAARVFEDLGCEVEQADIALDPPYDTFGPIIAGDFYTNFGRYKNNGDELFTDYAKFLLERGSQVTVADYARALGEMDLLEGAHDRPVRAIRPAAHTDGVLSSVQIRRISGRGIWHFRIPRSVLERGLHFADKRDWPPRGECTGGVHVRWSARRTAHVVGRELDEPTVLAASAAFESAQPWDHVRPPVS